MADRIEKEIEEILRRIDDIPGRKRAKAPRRGGGRPLAAAQSWVAHTLARLSMRKVMMWALFVVLVTFFARGVPGAYWLMIGALIVFVTAFLLSTRSGGSYGAPQKRWRGEPIDLRPPSLPNRIKAWLKGRRRA
jgi:hypothetical protein